MPEPLDRSTTWSYEGGEPGEFHYARDGHPTGAAAERALGELDGGEALLYASGAAATAGLVLALLGPGSTVALADDGYYGTGVLMRDLGRWGLEVAEFDQTGEPPPGADLLWVEAPSNPFLSMPDLERVAAYPAPVVVDSTAATPVHLRPLEHGADFALHSATKYLGGHDDVLLGAVVCARAEDASRLREFRSRSGLVAAPDAAWLLLRGLETLELRVTRQTETARELARRLERHSRVERVRYPGFGGLLSFDVMGGAAAARRVETSTRLIENATSLGGTRTLIEARSRWEGNRVPAGLLRLSAGLEDVDALWKDLEAALDADY